MWYKSFSNHPSLHSFVFIIIIITIINKSNNIRSSSLQTATNMAIFHSMIEKGARKKLNIENLCTEKAYKTNTDSLLCNMNTYTRNRIRSSSTRNKKLFRTNRNNGVKNHNKVTLCATKTTIKCTTRIGTYTHTHYVRITEEEMEEWKQPQY